MPRPFYATADADRIHQYVFSAAELRLIRGASIIQSQLNDDVRQAACDNGGRVFRANGGTTSAIFDGGLQANAFCERSAELFRERSHIATVTTAMVEEALVEEEARFAVTLQTLSTALETKKNARSGFAFNGGGPYWVVCETCGMLPASSHPADRVEAERRVCEACARKDEEGRPGHDRRLAGPHNRPQHFEWLGRQSRPLNYLAILYIDLDRLGRYMDEHAAGAGPDAYLALSGQIDDSVRKGIFRACDLVEQVDDPEYGVTDPYEILLAGGDDVLAALPPQHAFDVLFRFRDALNLSVFSIGDRKLPRPTFSAGIVFANSHYPIRESVSLADRLTRSAKNLPGRQGDAVDYSIVTASLAGPLERWHMPVHGVDAGNRARRTARPYSLDELHFLRGNIRKLKNESAPSSKIRQLYDLAWRGDMQADYDYLNLLWRLEKKHRDVLLETVGQSVWREDKLTRAADVAELWEFI